MYPSEKDVDGIVQHGYTVKTGKYIQDGWKVMQQYLIGFVGFAAIKMLISFAPLLVSERLHPSVVSIVNIIDPVLTAGYLIVAFKILKQQAITFNDFFRGFKYFLPIFLASLLIFMFVAIGVLFLLIPGIYLAIAYSFTLAFVVGHKLGFWEAMESSRKVVKQNWFSIFAFMFVLGLITLIGPLLLGISILFVAPLSEWYSTWVSLSGKVGPHLLLTIPVSLVTFPLSWCAIAVAFEDIVGLPTADNTIAQDA